MNGLAVCPDELPTFSCAAAPSLYPISPSDSSSFFRRPQIRHATMNKPARIAKPPIPTTTPITVLRVLGDMPEDFDEVEFSEASLVALGAVVSYTEVCEESCVEPSITVVRTTMAVVLVVCISVEEDLLDLLVLLDSLPVLLGVEDESDEVGVGEVLDEPEEVVDDCWPVVLEGVEEVVDEVRDVLEPVLELVREESVEEGSEEVLESDPVGDGFRASEIPDPISPSTPPSSLLLS